MVNANKDNVELVELDSRIGLNGHLSYWEFKCLYNQDNQSFFVWLGDVGIEKLTKSAFLNLADFA